MTIKKLASSGMFDSSILAVKEVGFPIVMCFLLLYGGLKLMDRLDLSIKEQSNAMRQISETLTEHRLQVKLEHERMVAELNELRQKIPGS